MIKRIGGVTAKLFCPEDFLTRGSREGPRIYRVSIGGEEKRGERGDARAPRDG